MEIIDKHSLVERAKAGNKKALEAIVVEYEKQIFSFCFRFFGNEEDAMDATQEVFIKIYRSLKNFEERSSLKTWIYRIASNTCITLSRAKKREKVGVLNSIINWWMREDSVNSPEEVVLEHEKKSITKHIVQEKLSLIQDVYRIPVIMKDVNGMSLDEISNILDVPKGTVKSRLSRGRRILQEKLRPYYGGTK